MEIRELILKKYGKFSDHHITFHSGINIIYGGNETGKTTIHSFIRAMFFGLTRARGRAAKTDEYQLRQPWDSPGAFLGSMRIEEDKEIFRIDRCFDRSSKPLSLVNETRMEESGDPEKDLEKLTGAISETAFVNSVFISQSHCETDQALADELRKYMINSNSTMDFETDVTKALQKLRKTKKQFEQEKKKEDEAIEEQIAQKQERADQIRGELNMLRREADNYRTAAGGLGENEDKEEPEEETEPEPGEEEDDNTLPAGFRILLCAMLFLAGAGTAAGIFLMGGRSLKIFLGIFTVIFWGMAAGVYLLFRPSSGKGNKAGSENLHENSGSLTQPAKNTAVPPELLKEIQSREESYRELQDDLETLYGRHVRPGGSDTDIRALDMAIGRISEISEKICRKNTGKLNEIASDILSEITDGRYNNIVIDDTAEITVHTPSRVLSLNQVSGGTMQQIYFAVRMAAGELLCPGVMLPVILDETFAMYDDERLESVLRWLKKSGKQVILFTCQNREREIMKHI